MPEQSLMDLLQKRRSIRKFKTDPVPEEMIRSCVEAARIAPSAENVQPWRFIAVTDPAKKKELADVAFPHMYRFSRWAADAPVIVALAAKLDILANRIGAHLQGTQYYLLDLGIAGEHFMLRAVEQGLGGCWIGWFHAKAASRALALPRNLKLTALLALGYPDVALDELKVKKRRDMDEILDLR